jgi:hypothetical protein
MKGNVSGMNGRGSGVSNPTYFNSFNEATGFGLRRFVLLQSAKKETYCFVKQYADNKTEYEVCNHSVLSCFGVSISVNEYDSVPFHSRSNLPHSQLKLSLSRHGRRQTFTL